MKRLLASFVAGFIVLLPTTALAHVVVQPSEVSTGTFQTFTTGVPNEKDQPTVTVKLVIPSGLGHITPTVKPGWTIEAVKDGDVVKEIVWSGGSIPAGQRDDFSFSAQAPERAGTLVWKARQTYADGTVVAWDQQPSGSHGDSSPYSETKVVAASQDHDEKDYENSDTLAVLLGTAGIVVGATALAISVSRR